MKELPILFSTPMVQANLDGRKTMTRRIVKPQPLNGLQKGSGDPGWYDTDYECTFHTGKFIQCPYGQPGDVLWVRETWCLDLLSRNVYKATDGELDGVGRKFTFSPSIHMPKIAARIWLQVEEIRVERLNEISEEDAMSEGVRCIERTSGYCWMDYRIGEYIFPSTAITSFKSLFLSINGKPKPQRERGETGKILSYTAIAWDQKDYEKTWKKFYGEYQNKPLHVIINPWVWVVKFKVLSTTGLSKIEPG